MENNAYLAYSIATASFETAYYSEVSYPFSLIGNTNQCYATAQPSNPELIPFRKGNKWGYCNEKREIIIPCKYDSVAQYFFLNRAYVMLGRKFGYIDASGKEVIPLKYSSAHDFDYRFTRTAWVTELGKTLNIDVDGKKIDKKIGGYCGGTIAIVGNGPDGEIVKNGTKFGFAVRYTKIDSITNKRICEPIRS